MRIHNPPASGLTGIDLRQLERADAAAWFEYLSLPEVFEHTSWDVQSPNDLEGLFDVYDSPAITSSRRLAIVEADAGTLIGAIGFHTVSDVNRSAELASDLSPVYWGRGIATSVCNAVTEWSYTTYDFERVQATVLTSNTRSEKVLRKCKFSLEGLLRSYRVVRGQSGDFLMYARLAGD